MNTTPCTVQSTITSLTAAIKQIVVSGLWSTFMKVNTVNKALHYSKDVQPLPNALYQSGHSDNTQTSLMKFNPHIPQFGMLPLDDCMS